MKRRPSDCGRLDPTIIAEPSPADDPAIIFLPDNEGRWGKRRHGFETIDAVQKERRLRPDNLREFVDRLPESQRDDALELADRLESLGRHDLLNSAADPGTMRELRRRFGGELHRLLRTEGPAKAKLYFLVSEKYRFPADDLCEHSPSLHLKRTQRLLERVGQSSRKQGWAVLAPDSEYGPITDTYIEHVHALVVGEM